MRLVSLVASLVTEVVPGIFYGSISLLATLLPMNLVSFLSVLLWSQPNRRVELTEGLGEP